MGLDITATKRRKITCPKCGEVVDYKDVKSVDSGGSAWYEFLEPIGYYVTYERRTEENDWYGKDMVLSCEQALKMRDFIERYKPYDGKNISSLIAEALLEGDDIVINADW